MRFSTASPPSSASKVHAQRLGAVAFPGGRQVLGQFPRLQHFGRQRPAAHHHDLGGGQLGAASRERQQLDDSGRDGQRIGAR